MFHLDKTKILWWSTSTKPNTTCRVFEDNVGALELANTPKLRPRTKHLSRLGKPMLYETVKLILWWIRTPKELIDFHK